MTSLTGPTTSSFLQDFIQKITLVPNDINRFIRLIRFLDKRLQKLQKILAKQQKDIIQKLSLLKDKDKKSLSIAMQMAMKQNSNFSEVSNKKVSQSNSLPLPLQETLNQYINILNIEKQVLGYAREKSAIGVQLSAQVRQYFELLQKQVRSKILREIRSDEIQSSNLDQMPIQDLINHLKKKRQLSSVNSTLGLKKRQDFFYDPKQDKFCYCGQASYGDMVFCQNLYCQRQWFHLNCIKENGSSLPEKWYCNQCQKMKDRTKNQISRSYFSIAS